MTSILQKQFDAVLLHLRSVGPYLQHVEIQDAHDGFPLTVLKSVSAFANGRGGLIVLGLAEPGFVPTGIDAHRLASILSSRCSDNLDPPIRPVIELCEVDGMLVVVAAVDELDTETKPCLVKNPTPKAYIRTHDGDRRLTVYEHHVLLAAKGQPTDDEQPVAGTSLDDLDMNIVGRVLHRVRTTRGPAFRDADDAECLRLLGVLTDTANGHAVTLAGLLAMGRYPQQHFPRLSLTFVAFATKTGEPLPDGTCYLDSQPIEGSIPVMLELAADALHRNMRRQAVVADIGRDEDIGRNEKWNYPLEAVREVVVNALMHRDYHLSAHGRPAMMALYPDRLEISNPGGIYGVFDSGCLMTELVTAARNARLAKLLQDVPTTKSDRTICENVGTGLISVVAHLRSAGLAPPEIDYNLSDFNVVLRNHAVLDQASLHWLSKLDMEGINERQRLSLAHVWRHNQIDNRGYRMLTGCDPGTAMTELTDLSCKGLLERSGIRRWRTWQIPKSIRKPERPERQQQASAISADNSSPATFSPATFRRSLTRRQQQVLDLLTDGPVTSADLAESLGVTRGAIHSWLRHLEERGLARTTQPGRRSRNQSWKRIDS